MKNNITVMVIVALAVGAGSFFGGMKYQESKRPVFTRQFGGNQGGPGAMLQGQRGGPGGRAGFRPVSGEILASDATSITVKLNDGSSKIVLITDKTEINKADQATKEDLKVGERVAVFGADNSDGSVTAQNVQLNPMFRGGSGSPSATPKQ